MATYKIFISGPSDVNEYIELARHVISEINMLTGPLGIKFEPFDWLESATPGIGSEPQAVINEQAMGYAAIVAIVGAKLGSPTADFDSGTIEELERALSSLSQLPFGSKSVMVFFKESQLDLKSADLASALKVQELRSSLGPRGILFKDFSTDQKFRESLLRCFGLIIASHFSKVGTQADISQSPEAFSSVIDSISESYDDKPVSQFEDDELGIMDLGVLQEDLMAESTLALRDISIAMNLTTEHIKNKSDELGRANSASDTKRVRAILTEISQKMLDLADVIDEKAPVVGTTYKKAIEYLRALVELSSSDLPETTNPSQMNELKEVVLGLMGTVIDARAGISSYMKSVSGLPRLTKEIGAARRRLSAANQTYLEILDGVTDDTQAMLNYLNARDSGSPRFN